MSAIKEDYEELHTRAAEHTDTVVVTFYKTNFKIMLSRITF